VGSTNNPVKRLRQHNGDLVGGAKYTRAGRKTCYVEGFPDRRTALGAETPSRTRATRWTESPRLVFQRRRWTETEEWVDSGDEEEEEMDE